MQFCSWRQSVTRQGKEEIQDSNAYRAAARAVNRCAQHVEMLRNALNHVMNEQILSRVRVHRTQHRIHAEPAENVTKTDEN